MAFVEEHIVADEPVSPSLKKIPLVEVFGPTVQGEGAVIGQQTYFLRFGLCDYKCTMCDSMHAVDPVQVRANAKWLTQEQIFRALQEHRDATGPYSTKWVTFSGGNPCIHNLQDLVTALRLGGWQIVVETQGTFNPMWLVDVDVISISPKGPGMGEKLELDKLDKLIINLTRFFHGQFYLKIVIFDERDLEVARMLYERYVLTNVIRPNQVFLSLGNPYPPGKTEFGEDGMTIQLLRNVLTDNYKSLLADIMKDRHLSQVRFLPQMHVLIYGNKQGV